MNEHLNDTPNADGILPPRMATQRTWLIVAAAIGGLVLVAIAFFFFLAEWLGRPVVPTIDEVDVNAIEKMGVLVLNRPDGGPDISAGGKIPFAIPPADYDRILAPLREATVIEKSRGIYLGQLQIQFRNGRKLLVYLHRVGNGNDPNDVPVLQFHIGQQQFEVVPLERFLKPLIEVEAKVKAGR